MMKKSILIILLTSLVLILVACNKGQGDIENKGNAQSSVVPVQNSQEIFYGQWIIKKAVAHEAVGTYGKDEMEKIEGNQLSFSKEKASCFGDDIKYLDDIIINPVYKKNNVSKSSFAVNHRITLEALGIKNTDYITEIQVIDSKKNGCVFYIKDNNTLILYGGGVYFELDRKI